ncbi:hypothetical protein M231_02570 [Tremella mesenterica]|uniref:ferric-chelate reductase (NADPH) n=1 Tax=Tremella mesenterica TaxID=5217 RepID=A0A4Q1BQB8_TREME|nr:hypothetical protein M231_02570 [Tremella mesenterica]
MSSVNLHGRYIPIPTQFQVYQSYTVDPQWQITFTIIWTSILVFTTLLSLPYAFRAVGTGRWWQAWSITESDTPSRSSVVEEHVEPAPIPETNFFSRSLNAGYAVWQSAALFTPPLPSLRVWKYQVADCCRRAYFSLSFSQIFIVLAYTGIVIACIVKGVDLTSNSNRAGFVGLATLPVILTLSLKSPLPVPVFLPTLSYEHYNFLHRWAGRVLFLAVTIHGSLWINQFIYYKEYDELSADKTIRGLLAYGLLGGIVITSLKPVRRLCYQVFWIAHISLFVGFFAAICYHTPYAIPWVTACAGIYAYDLVVRMIRFRIKDAILVPVDNTLTMVHIPDCNSGWLPTQHVNLRILRGTGLFESHPFTITNAPSSSSRGITLYAKVAGDWTRRVHNMAREVVQDVLVNHPGKRVLCMLDGPYGGLKLDLGAVESVLLVGGGSGITFVLGSIEEALSARKAGGRTRNVDVAWVVRDLSTIHALAPTLSHLRKRAEIIGLRIQYQLYLTDPPSPLPPILDSLRDCSTISPYRPEVAQLVRAALPLPNAKDVEAASEKHGGGLAVVACGPEGLVMEGKNAVAGLGIGERVACGGVHFHAETYAL